MKTSEGDPIRLDFVRLSDAIPGRLGLTLAPGKVDTGFIEGPWKRDLEADLKRLREEYGVNTLICLLTQDELLQLQIPKLIERAGAHGMETEHLPIPDGGTPDDAVVLASLVRRIREALRAGSVVAVHCRGGLGRTGLVAACCLVALGLDAAEAVRRVREARRRTIENAQQESYVYEFAARWNEQAS